MADLRAYFRERRARREVGVVLYTILDYPTPEIWRATVEILARHPVVFETSIALRPSPGVGEEVGRGLEHLVTHGITPARVAEGFSRLRPNAVLVHETSRMSADQQSELLEQTARGFDAILPCEGDDDTYARVRVGRVSEAWTTMSDAEIVRAATQATAFVYLRSAPLTGAQRFPAAALAETMRRIRAHSDVPIGCGFGIRTPADVAELAQLDECDAVIIGSELLRRMVRAHEDGQLQPLADYIDSIMAATARG